jgi:aminoglycoside phosphotransferase (APT) family kinase protein
MTTHRPALDETRLTTALTTWIGERLGEEGRRVDRVECELAGAVATGNSNVTMPFTARWSGESAGCLELVLRMQVPENRIFLDADVLREAQVLEGLGEEGSVPVPTPRWVEADSRHLGQPFFVMDRVDGTVPTGVPSFHASGRLAASSVTQRRRAWDSALSAIAAIASVDWRRELPFLGEGATGTTLQTRLAHMSEWYRWVTAGRTFAITDAALDELTSSMPAETGPPVLVWGDARIGNLMFADDWSVAAVLDWELASIGPAGIDLGWWLAFEEFAASAHGVAPLTGWPGRDDTIARYQQLTGRTVAELHWFEMYALWVLTVTVIRMADIGVANDRLPADNRMGEGNLTAQMLARRLGLPVPDLDPHYAARRGLPVR